MAGVWGLGSEHVDTHTHMHPHPYAHVVVAVAPWFKCDCVGGEGIPSVLLVGHGNPMYMSSSDDVVGVGFLVGALRTDWRGAREIADALGIEVRQVYQAAQAHLLDAKWCPRFEISTSTSGHLCLRHPSYTTIIRNPPPTAYEELDGGRVEEHQGDGDFVYPLRQYTPPHPSQPLPSLNYIPPLREGEMEVENDQQQRLRPGSHPFTAPTGLDDCDDPGHDHERLPPHRKTMDGRSLRPKRFAPASADDATLRLLNNLQ